MTLKLHNSFLKDPNSCGQESPVFGNTTICGSNNGTFDGNGNVMQPSALKCFSGELFFLLFIPTICTAEQNHPHSVNIFQFRAMLLFVEQKHLSWTPPQPKCPSTITKMQKQQNKCFFFWTEFKPDHRPPLFNKCGCAKSV